MSNFGFLLDEGERIEAVLAHLQAGAPRTWRPHRIIFRNFWFFQKEEFIWHHGRLFLGGQNTAGKSTVLSMAVPFLLDGNKSEERLNTFGGHGRHMAYYVTGSPTPNDTSEAAYHHSARTSYLALEFCNREASGEEKYLTFGQGLHHDRGAEDKSVRSWGFVINDGRRIGRNHRGQLFDVVKDSGASLTKAELRKSLGSGGEVFDTNQDYRRTVNRLLFGFRDLRDFDALIDLLLQIRRPKLTREVKPRDVAENLTQSLPGLDDGVMQVTAKSLDHIDRTTENVERIELQIKAVGELDKAAQTVFRRMAEGAAAHFQQAYRAAEEAQQKLVEREGELEAARATLAEASVGLADCHRRLAQLEAEKAELQGKDTFLAADQLSKVRQEIQDSERKSVELRKQLRDHEAKLVALARDRQGKERDWQREREEGLEIIVEAADEAEAARWESAVAWIAGLRKMWEGLSVDLTDDQPGMRLLNQIPRAAVEEGARERLDLIAAMELTVARRDEAKGAWERAMGAEQSAQKRLIDAEAEATRVASLVEDGRRLAAESVLDWAGATEILRIPERTMEVIAEGLLRYVQRAGGKPQDLLAPARPFVEKALSETYRARAESEARLKDLVEKLSSLRTQRQYLDQAPPEPHRSEDQNRARQALAEEGIPFVSLFETVDFADGLEPTAAARLEQALAEMGLLDALVVSEEHRESALDLLRQRGLSERLLLPGVGERLLGPGADESALEIGPGLGEMLRADELHPSAEAVAPLLGRIGLGGWAGGEARGWAGGEARGWAGGEARGWAGGEARRPLAFIRADGLWRHGFLEGIAPASAHARYIGRSTRERFRRLEIARLEEEISTVATAISQEKDQIEGLTRRTDQIQAEWDALEGLTALRELQALGMQLEVRRGAVERESNALEAARLQTASAREAWEGREADLLEQCRNFPSAAGLNRQGLQELGARTRNVRAAFDTVHQRARMLQSHWEVIDRIREQAASEEAQRDQKEEMAEGLAVALRGMEGRRLGLERLLESPDARGLFARLQVIGVEAHELSTREKALNREEAVAEKQVQRLKEEVPHLRASASETADESGNARIRLLEATGAYPTLQSFAEMAVDTEGACQAARSLLSRFTDRPSLVEDIREMETGDRAELSKVFEAKRQMLRDFYPEHLPTERTARLVQFSVDGTRMTPYTLLSYLQTQADAMKTLLQKHEAELFERHLLQDVGREVRRCLIKARDWVDDINKKLEAYPLRNGERVELDWKPKQTEHELGGTIARHANLLWIDEANLTLAQRDTLKGSFQEEIRQIREQAKRGEWRADVFREKLNEVLDYRTWFRFRIHVRGDVTGRTEITDTVHNARSGSERALVLLLPLIAGLSVRYEHASPDAPRLLGLDEGFAGIDAVNSRQLIRFLTALGLTWVVTSEKPPAVTEDLTGASIYSMLRDGTVVTSRPFFWDGQRLLDAEAEFWEAGSDVG